MSIDYRPYRSCEDCGTVIDHKMKGTLCRACRRHIWILTIVLAPFVVLIGAGIVVIFKMISDAIAS